MSRESIPRGVDLVVRPARVEASLWRRFRFESEGGCREHLFNRYVDFARKLAGRHFSRRPTPRPELTDYRQFAYEGLLDAIDRFDPLVGAPFQSFARRRILGCISDGIARMSELGAQLGQRRRVERERMRSLADADRGLSSDALAALSQIAAGLALGLMLEDVGLAAGEDHPDPRPSAYDSLAFRQLQVRLSEAVAQLPEREAAVVGHHYSNGLSFGQIAELMGLSKGRISQLHHSALERLRKRLGR